MSGGRFRKLVLLGLLAGLVAAALRALRGGPAPAFEAHLPADRLLPEARAAVEAVLAPVADVAADEPVAEVPAPAAEPARPAGLHVEAIAADGTAFTVLDEPSSPAAPAPAATGGDPDARWVAPVDGACPTTHPIKGKLKSGIFHQPGGLAYERTKPDRCYRSATDAEADGLRAAKR